MNTPRLTRHLCAGALLLASLHAMAAPATGTAETIWAISDARVQAIQQDWSANNSRNTQVTGQKIYQAICQTCHMADGQGAQGAGFYPALAGNPKLAAGQYPVSIVMQGLHGMPSFGHRLDDEQVASVVNYIRTSFGNQFTDPVKAEDVKAFRK